MKLCFPEDILRQHLAVLGKTGAGKSSALRHIVEHLLSKNKRVCIIDPKGDWWGLKKSADGKSPGVENIIAFGDFKDQRAADIPINAQSGKHVAELISTGNRPCIIGFRGWMTGHMVRFWIDFASTLFTTNSGELYLVGDEFHNFAPKGKIMDPEAGKCLHWSNRLMSEGRGYGLVCLIASQRPQKVHNDTLTCCETLVAMRVVHKADRDAVQDWIEGCGDMNKGREVLNSLAGMARGEAFVWSPEIGFGPTRLTFPMFESFDSFAPPQLQKKVSNSGWNAVDLDAVKDKLADVIEEAKANDPAELKRHLAEARKEIGKLKSELERGPKAGPDKEVPVLTAEDRRLIERAEASCLKIIDAMEKANAKVVESVQSENDRFLDSVRDMRKFLEPLHAKISALPQRAGMLAGPKTSVKRVGSAVASPAPAFRRPMPAVSTNGNSSAATGTDIGGGERKILIAVAQYPGGVERDQLSVLTGYKRSSRDTYVARLRQANLVSIEGDRIVITESGASVLGTDYEMLPTGDALVEHWRHRLPEGERKIFEMLVERNPESVQRDELDDLIGFKRSSRDTYIYRLRARRVIQVVGRGEIRLAQEFFE